MTDTLYRFQDKKIIDSDDMVIGITLSLYEYPVIKLTKKGIWLARNQLNDLKQDKWFNPSRENPYAYSTPDRAWKGYHDRQQYRATYLRKQLKRINFTLEIASREIPFSPAYFDGEMKTDHRGIVQLDFFYPSKVGIKSSITEIDTDRIGRL